MQGLDFKIFVFSVFYFLRDLEIVANVCKRMKDI